MRIRRLFSLRPGRPSLRRVFYRANLTVALVSVCMAGLAVTVVGLLALRAYAEHNLHLITRSMAYTTEAAVVFRDAAAAEEALQAIAAEEEVAEAAVYDANGRRLAGYQRPSGPMVGLERRLTGWLLDDEYSRPILHNDRRIGEVRVSGSGGGLLTFLLTGLGGTFAGLLLAALGALHLSQRMVAKVLGPLDRLASVAHAIRRDRDFAQRVPPARIVELNELSEDFNALLDELDSWQTHLEKENATLAHKASHDSLTRLPNRAFFEGRLSRALRDVAAHGQRVAVLFIDSDRFKSINDELGHAAGDAVLVSIATRIRGQLRETDLVARLGGDEFAVLLSPVASPEDAVRIADDIIASMELPIPLPDGGSVRTSLTIGIALCPEHGSTPEALLRSADLAMYHAKRRQRGTRLLAQQPVSPVPIEKQEKSREPAESPARPGPADACPGRLPDATADRPDARTDSRPETGGVPADGRWVGVRPVQQGAVRQQPGRHQPR
ncbi:Diguanylate cyclase DgcN [Pseudomonas carbonaria]|uniref:Diguanylate cyclase DgcN n=1 Tax=Zestomonas carbonaria TaxID=2762745 RepID=A0A7U7EQI1_9GAMM|nr:Diguanylate cyclase DgcN [Pseudomonas carbonaria]